MRVNVIDYLFCFFYAFLLMSGFSTLIFDISGNYFFEGVVIFSLVFHLFYPSKVFGLILVGVKKNIKKIMLCAVFLFLMFVVGWTVGHSAKNSYGDFRALLCIPIGYFFFVESKKYNFEGVVALFGLCTGLTWIVFWVYANRMGIIGSKFPVPILSVVSACLIFGVKKNKIESMLSLLCLGFIAAIGMFRQYWLYVVLAGGFVLVCYFKTGTYREKVLWGFLLSVFIAFLVVIGSWYIVYYSKYDQSFYIQTVGKTQDLMNAAQGFGALSESDAIRLGYFKFIIIKWYELLIPHGIGYRSFLNLVDPWFDRFDIIPNTIDSGLLYSVFHFGWILTFFILFKIIKNMWKGIKTYGIVLSAILFLLFATGILFDGAELVIINRAFWLGVFFAFWFEGASYDRTVTSCKSESVCYR